MYRPTQSKAQTIGLQKLVFGPMTEAPEVPDRDSVRRPDRLHRQLWKRSAELAKYQNNHFFSRLASSNLIRHFVAPKKYWDLYNSDQTSQSPTRTTNCLIRRAGSFAGHRSGEIRRYTDQPNRGEFPESNQRRMKHGYYACISYVDAQVGKVIDALESNGLADNTIVVLFGDHGYHLGEHGLWGKTTNFELDTRVPLMIRVPDMNQPGVASRVAGRAGRSIPDACRIGPIAGRRIV